MMKKLDRKDELFTISSADIKAADESFPCPKCGKKISPEEEESNDNYKILDTKVINDELAELVIACGRCGSIIKLI